MNSEVKTEWVAALRSGDYAQGNGVLRDKDKFCCLGVLCDLAVRHGVIEEPVLGVLGFLYDGGTAFLPDSVTEWSGVAREGTLSEPVEANGHNAYTLVAANDYGLSFEEIAGIIEGQL